MNTSGLAYQIARYFSVVELKDLARRLDVDYEEIQGTVKSEKAIELVQYLTRRGQLPALLEELRTLRPHVAWNTDLPSEDADVSPVSVLFLSAEPYSFESLRIGEEVREIQTRLQLSLARKHISLELRLAVRPADLIQALLDVRPRVVHFSGHGLESGKICLEDAAGRMNPVSPSALRSVFHPFREQVQCLVLNACYSEIQAAVLQQEIEYVIGSTNAIIDAEAIAFSIGFYQAIGARLGYAEAYELGCAQMKMAGTAIENLPKLHRWTP